MGSASWLPETENVLLCNGMIRGGFNFFFSQILEVTRDGTRLFDLTIEGDDKSFTMYRARRIEDIRR
jgi:hypothetical protein